LNASDNYTKTTECLDRRRAGVLLHISSLPGRGATGELGPEAYHFVDFLADAGISVWQTLPLGPTLVAGSPYQTRSVHAGNRWFIGLQPLADAGWIDAKILKRKSISFDCKQQLLHNAWAGFNKLASDDEKKELARFIGEQRFWLEDYALFEALREEHNCIPWWEWPSGIRDRQPQALAEARSRFAEELQYIYFEQYLFFSQWMELKRYANEKEILLFGDMPIFVAHDSAEVWAHRDNFLLDSRGHPTKVAGVPPDYFSETGQRWGNPLYRWDRMAEDGFSFWVDRMKTQLSLFDLLRIDHFRGFEAYWEIPAEDDSAINGHWVKAPGRELFNRLHHTYDPLPLVAEDLGVITPEVDRLREQFGLPGMKVLQFAFYGDSTNPYLPFRHPANSVVYTGTHDNDTTLGWYRTLDDTTRSYVDEFFGFSREPMPWPVIREALASRAKLAMLPMQDILSLDGEHRMNLPGTVDGNWQWRFDWDQVDSDLAQCMRHNIGIYGRRVEE
jgi:4-alpha-glucanotransferase